MPQVLQTVRCRAQNTTMGWQINTMMRKMTKAVMMTLLIRIFKRSWSASSRILRILALKWQEPMQLQINQSTCSTWMATRAWANTIHNLCIRIAVWSHGRDQLSTWKRSWSDRESAMIKPTTLKHKLQCRTTRADPTVPGSKTWLETRMPPKTYKEVE